MENNKIYELTKEEFQNSYNKQIKLFKTILLSVFLPLGITFIILGITLSMNVKKELFIFVIVGIFLIFIGMILFIFFPNNVNYDKQQKRIEKYGYVNIYQISANVKVLNSKIKELEDRIEELEKKTK